MADNEEKPLDPEVEKVRRRMMRLMIVSILIMLVGLIAVFAGVVYKINGKPEQDTSSPAIASEGAEANAPLYSGGPIVVELPDGAKIADKRIDGNVLLIDALLQNGGRQYFIVDLTTGKVATTVSFE